MKLYVCPVCYFDKLEQPPRDYTICQCCGTEFENDDETHSHKELRKFWVQDGMVWFFENPPKGWDPTAQLARYERRA